MMAAAPRLLVTSHLTILLLLLLTDARRCTAQAINADQIIFTTQPGWIDMRSCARCPFVVDFGVCNIGNDISGRAGCNTNACLCRPSTLGEAVSILGSEVLALCSNYDDQRTATSFLIAYCSAHGYTSVGSAVFATETGACTITAATRTVTVTATIRVSGAAAFPMWSSGIFLVTVSALALLL